MCSHYNWFIIQRFLSFETKQSPFESLCVNNHVFIFFPHQLFFPRHFPTCDVDHRKKTLTIDNVHQKKFESMVIYPNGHNLWCVIGQFHILLLRHDFSFRSSSKTSSLRPNAVIHPLTIVIPLIQNVTFPFTPPPRFKSKNLDITYVIF